MRKTGLVIQALLLSAALLFSGCGNTSGEIRVTTAERDSEKETTEKSSSGKEETKKETKKETEQSSEKETTEEKEKKDFSVPELQEGVNSLKVTVAEGTQNCWEFADGKLTFQDLKADTICSVSGDFAGQIVIDAADYKFELELNDVTLYSRTESPLVILSGDKVTISAKKESGNFIYDLRDGENASEEEYDAAIYSKCDTDLQGKGELTVISDCFEGIHSKKDIDVKNLTLNVFAYGDALQGNDSVTVEGGVHYLVSETGDAVKTSASDVSKKGNQRGSVCISGGVLDLFAACDGIDAEYNTEISGGTVRISTDQYSPYSQTVEASGEEKDENARYIRFNLDAYSFSVKYYNSDSDYKWADASFYKSVNGGMQTYYYYKLEKLAGYQQVQFFIYGEGQKQGQEEEYLLASDYMIWNDAYDTFAMEARGNTVTYNWTNYADRMTGSFGGPGGFGGMNDGNTDKGDHSTKGIKAGNEIHVTGGTLQVESYDDALHVSGEKELENGKTATGNIDISGGTLLLFTKDDAIHAGGIATVSGGVIDISGCYEGIEGNRVVISGGDVSIVSSDDGMNSTAKDDTGITFEGGYVYIYAGGDGVDSNSREEYQGILFEGGEIVIISTTSMNSAIDTENGYKYTGGKVLAVCPYGSMTREVIDCKNFSSVGTQTTQSLTKGQTISVLKQNKEQLSVTMPCSLSAFVVYLGDSGVSFETK